MQPVQVGERAFGKVRRIVRNALIDMRFGPPLAAVYLRDRAQSNCDYRELEHAFCGRVDEADVLVDVGCGAGRVINHWLRSGVGSHIYGLEIDERMGAITKFRLRRRQNVSIVIGDAISNLPADGTVFFLFNPFDESTTRRFATAVLEPAHAADRCVRVVYLNCKHLAVFEDHPEFEIEMVQRGPGAPATLQALAVITVG